MLRLPARREEPLPASYLLAAGLGSVAILISYATAEWVPWFVRDMAGYVPHVYALGTGLLLLGSSIAGALMATVPWLALEWPAVAIGVAVVPIGISVLDPDRIGVHFGVFVALCSIVLTAGWRSPRGAIVAAGVAAAFVIGWLVSGAQMSAPFRALILLRDVGAGDRLLSGLLYLVALGGVGFVAWRMRVSGLRELERRALAERSADVEQQSAVVAERARLARDLHDVVAHHVSLIAVRAETAPYTHPSIGEDARGVLTDIAADARLALDELRGVLGILGRSGEAERAPQPTWSDITALVERTRSAGVDVEMIGDTSADVAPTAGYAAYRVVQEALTNARKHAPGARVTVDLETTSQLLTVLVSTPLAAAAAPPATGGQGLVGMRERVEALGGRLLSGPVGEDFVVEAILPRGIAEGAA